MVKTIISTTTLCCLFILAGCGPSGSDGAAADHEHGPDTHTHDAPVSADTAGTYVDTTSTFFENEVAPAEETQTEHSHGADTHTHN